MLAGLALNLNHVSTGELGLAWLIASVGMGITSAIVNDFMLLPVLEAFMPLEQRIASFEKFLRLNKAKLNVVLFNENTFNSIKGLAISAATMLLYKRFPPILNGGQK